VQRRPLANQPHGGLGLDASRQYLPLEVELGLLSLMLRMEVRRLMLFVEHPNHNPEERRDDRHIVEYTPGPNVLEPYPAPEEYSAATGRQCWRMF